MLRSIFIAFVDGQHFSQLPFRTVFPDGFLPKNVTGMIRLSTIRPPNLKLEPLSPIMVQIDFDLS